MTPEEINKKAHGEIPADVQEAASEYADNRLAENNRQLAESGHTRHFKMGYVCFAGYEIEQAVADGMLAERERIAALPTIKGWVARDSVEDDFSGTGLILHHHKPTRCGGEWSSPTIAMHLPSNMFPDLRWEDEPIEVELPIIRK